MFFLRFSLAPLVPMAWSMSKTSGFELTTEPDEVFILIRRTTSTLVFDLMRSKNVFVFRIGWIDRCLLVNDFMTQIGIHLINMKSSIKAFYLLLFISKTDNSQDAYKDDS